MQRHVLMLYRTLCDFSVPLEETSNIGRGTMGCIRVCKGSPARFPSDHRHFEFDNVRGLVSQ